MTYTWKKRTQHEETNGESKRYVHVISYIFFFGKCLLSIFLCPVCLEYKKHSMFFHFKKYFVFCSSQTCIKACLAKNTEPWWFSKSKLKSMSLSDSKLIPFSSMKILIILILPASLKTKTKQNQHHTGKKKTNPEMKNHSNVYFSASFQLRLKLKFNYVHIFT